MGIVYMATCQPNGKKYIGRTTMEFKRRHKRHIEQMRYGSPDLLHRAMRKYGQDAFSWEILYVTQDKSDLLRAERELVEAWNTMHPNGYNMTMGGDGSLGFRHTKEAKHKMSIVQRGKIVSEETRRRMGAWQVGRKLSPETIAKRVEKIRGRKLSEEHRQKLSLVRKGNKNNLGNKASIETRRRMSESHKGKTKNAEWRLKIKVSNIVTAIMKRRFA